MATPPSVQGARQAQYLKAAGSLLEFGDQCALPRLGQWKLLKETLHAGVDVVKQLLNPCKLGAVNGRDCGRIHDRRLSPEPQLAQRNLGYRERQPSAWRLRCSALLLELRKAKRRGKDGGRLDRTRRLGED
ncbi:hypothetical protein ACQ86G_23745 [Roseateles chitinivorans]|uniref:hypothetical protein n=1 Tax=Roseateles chitinivorans TaxID=2917965 RepID=UPI003D679600